MANFQKKMELSGKSKSSFSNRSLTMHPTAPKPQIERNASIKKICDNSNESVKSASSPHKGKVKKLHNFFEPAKPTTPGPSERQPKTNPVKSSGPDSRIITRNASIRLPGTEDRIVLYLTSLRGVRRTYEDCYAVRMIFSGFRVCVDERDISMDSEYRRELQNILNSEDVGLPQVFIGGKYVGGADVIKSLFEIGELPKILNGFPVRTPGSVCEGCGDVRFVPCANCSGSRKVFNEEEDNLKRCLECNENGLIRCPDCCS